MTAEVPPTPARRRIHRSGGIALIASAALVVWVVLLIWLGLNASGSDAAGAVAYVMFFASWVVIPVLAIGVLVFAIIALLFNPVPGKILAALAIVLPFAVIAVFLSVLGLWDALGQFFAA